MQVGYTVSATVDHRYISERVQYRDTVRLIGSHMQCIEWCYIQWPWVTPTPNYPRFLHLCVALPFRFSGTWRRESVIVSVTADKITWRTITSCGLRVTFELQVLQQVHKAESCSFTRRHQTARSVADGRFIACTAVKCSPPSGPTLSLRAPSPLALIDSTRARSPDAFLLLAFTCLTSKVAAADRKTSRSVLSIPADASYVLFRWFNVPQIYITTCNMYLLLRGPSIWPVLRIIYIFITHACIAASVGIAFSRVCLSVCDLSLSTL